MNLDFEIGYIMHFLTFNNILHQINVIFIKHDAYVHIVYRKDNMKHLLSINLYA